tara:strand:+ start:623 stop:1090 length:468 start_codon:yes stop_codon:yes gene_type:complete
MLSVKDLTLEESIYINSPISRIWTIFTQLESWPTWNSICTDSHWLGEQEWKDQGRFIFNLEMGSFKIPFTVKVAEYSYHQKIAWESNKISITGRREFIFEKVDSSTTLVTDKKLFSSSFLPIKLFYPTWVIKNMSKQWLDNLKSYAENQEAHYCN